MVKTNGGWSEMGKWFIWKKIKMQNQSPRRDRLVSFLLQEFVDQQPSLFSFLWSFSAAPFFFHSGGLLGQTCKIKQKQSPLRDLLAHEHENVEACLEASLVASGHDTLSAFLFVIGSCFPQSVLENSQSLTVISELVFSKTLSFDCPSILPNIEIKLSCSFGSSWSHYPEDVTASSSRYP